MGIVEDILRPTIDDDVEVWFQRNYTWDGLKKNVRRMVRACRIIGQMVLITMISGKMKSSLHVVVNQTITYFICHCIMKTVSRQKKD